MSLSKIGLEFASVISESSMEWVRKLDNFGPSKDKDFEEYSYVYLAHAVEHDGVTLPAGTRGAIVEKYPDGGEYIVEFTHPHFMVITLSAKDLKCSK